MPLGIIPIPKPIRMVEEDRTICYLCKQPISININSERKTELCDCGCLIYYFPKPHRPYGMRTFVSKSTYNKDKIKEKERQKLFAEAKKRGISLKIANTSKLHRTIVHEPVENGVIPA